MGRGITLASRRPGSTLPRAITMTRPCAPSCRTSRRSDRESVGSRRCDRRGHPRCLLRSCRSGVRSRRHRGQCGRRREAFALRRDHARRQCPRYPAQLRLHHRQRTPRHSPDSTRRPRRQHRQFHHHRGASRSGDLCRVCRSQGRDHQLQPRAGRRARRRRHPRQSACARHLAGTGVEQCSLPRRTSPGCAALERGCARRNLQDRTCR